jgi:hypothetical protein
MYRSTHISSALFVDFDNMFLRLKGLPDPSAATMFATQPDRWLEWLEKEMSLAHFGDGVTSRRILVRKCYLNPASFGIYRPFFTRAAFEVVDCPQLTKEGKTSTDIHMVMDIMDALHHTSRFDEFILFSADADFTPVLMRVRQYDRRSVVAAVGYSSPAYKSACDYLPPVNTFLQKALGIGLNDEVEEKLPILPGVMQVAVLDRMGEVISQRLAVNGPVNAYELPAIFKRVDEFRESTTWLGFRSLRNLTEAVVARRSDIKCVEEPEEGNWGVRFIGDEEQSAGNGSAQAGFRISQNHEQQPEQNIQPLLQEISTLVIEKVNRASKPVPMGSLAEVVKETFGEQINGSYWLGFQTFKGLLKQLDLNGLKIHNITPGYVYNPEQHDLHSLNVQNLNDDRKNLIELEFRERYPEIEPIARQIHHLTDMPYLLPEHYALILGQVARAVNENGFALAQTTRLVRDRCVERGAPVARSHVNFVVIGINYAGYKIGQSEEPETTEKLGQYLYENALNLCQSAQLALSEEDKRLVHDWLFCAMCPPNPAWILARNDGAEMLVASL